LAGDASTLIASQFGIGILHSRKHVLLCEFASSSSFASAAGPPITPSHSDHLVHGRNRAFDSVVLPQGQSGRRVLLRMTPIHPTLKGRARVREASCWYQSWVS
jgi:hypothetical protein